VIAVNRGRIFVVGIGPGSYDYLTAQAVKALEESDMIIGYHLYIKQVADIIEGKEIISSAMGKEVDRCRRAVAEAAKGKKVALISGGDPGIYGMAGLLLQVAQEEDSPPEVEIVPGVTAAGAAAALLGAPLMHDFAVISLSDLLTPWETIEKRLHAAAEADFIVVLYNPRSHGRTDLLAKAREIILKHRRGETAVGMVRGAGRDGEKKWKTTLDELTCCMNEADMATLVIIGNSRTYWNDGKMITPRGYEL
jgi:precorrin-3B C17-methyltransferase